MGHVGGRVVLQKVLYVPTMVHNLRSRSQALAKGAKEEADVSGFTLKCAGGQAIVLTGDTGGMWRLRQRLQVQCTSASDERQIVSKVLPRTLMPRAGMRWQPQGLSRYALHMNGCAICTQSRSSELHPVMQLQA